MILLGKVNVRNRHRETPLLLAVRADAVEVVSVLLGFGARLDDPDVNGEAALALLALLFLLHFAKAWCLWRGMASGALARLRCCHLWCFWSANSCVVIPKPGPETTDRFVRWNQFLSLNQYTSVHEVNNEEIAVGRPERCELTPVHAHVRNAASAPLLLGCSDCMYHRCRCYSHCPSRHERTSGTADGHGEQQSGLEEQVALEEDSCSLYPVEGSRSRRFCRVGIAALPSLEAQIVRFHRRGRKGLLQQCVEIRA